MHHFDIVHLVVSSLVHGLIYAAIFKLFHRLSVGAAILVAAVGVASVWLTVKLLRSLRG